jgi:hypothetical protein
MNGELKYEVAFSFLQDDEQLALEIANRVRDRVSVGVFVYSERQEELVGTDGVDAFSRIFGEESRIVVVLFREGWGQTPWTRTEENAIRARGFKEGHEFVLLVKPDAANPPVWLPPTRIYLGFDRYGIDGVASVIEARVQATGGTVHGESVADYAARISRDLDFERERRAFLASDRDVDSAKREVEVLFGEINRLGEQVNQTGSRIQVTFERSSVDFCRVSTINARFGVTWRLRWGNNLEGAGLTFILSEGGEFHNGYTFEEPSYQERLSYDVDLDRAGAVGWRESESERRFLTSVQLAEFWTKRLLAREHGLAQRQS